MAQILAMESFPLLTAVALGLLGFVEPCSIGSSLLVIQHLESRPLSDKIFHVAIFTLTRALVLGLFGVLAAVIGETFLGMQRAGWMILGGLYVAVGGLYLLDRTAGLMWAIGPKVFGRGGTMRSTALGILFGLNIPACAAPLLAATLGAAAATGSAGRAAVATGWLALTIFGLALSLPLVLAVLWNPARKALDYIARLARRVPLVTGVVFIALGTWSITIGLRD